MGLWEGPAGAAFFHGGRAGLVCGRGRQVIRSRPSKEMKRALQKLEAQFEVEAPSGFSAGLSDLQIRSLDIHYARLKM